MVFDVPSFCFFFFFFFFFLLPFHSIQVEHRKQLQLLEEERLAQENIQMRRHMEHLEEIDRQKQIKAKEQAAQRAVDLGTYR